MRLLLIEDDPLLGQGITLGLREAGYLVDWRRDGQTGLTRLRHEEPELIVLDLNLPDMDGLQVLKEVRRLNIASPVLILTATDSVEDRIKGLDCGADDYLLKPFSLKELGARVRALHRRAHGRAEERLIWGELTVDTAARKATYRGQPVLLGRREFDLLLTLLDSRGRVLTRRHLSHNLYEQDPESNSLEVLVHALRKKIDRNLIRTVRGVGYIIEH